MKRRILAQIDSPEHATLSCAALLTYVLTAKSTLSNHLSLRKIYPQSQTEPLVSPSEFGESSFCHVVSSMALGSSSSPFTSTRLPSLSFPSKSTPYRGTSSFRLLCVRASATRSNPKARFVARRKESVLVRQLERPLSNVREQMKEKYLDYCFVLLLLSCLFVVVWL